MNSPSFTWIKSTSLHNFSPITQVSGICFNAKSEILICRKNSDSEWQLPGGKPEKGETLEQTLEREFLEEVTITIIDIKPFGVHKVSYPNNPNHQEGDEFYQARMICKVQEILPQKLDPATGELWERIFVPEEEIQNYITWGHSGEQMWTDLKDISKH